VGARPARHIAHEETSGLVSLDHGRKALHESILPCEGPPNKPSQTACRRRLRAAADIARLDVAIADVLKGLQDRTVAASEP